MGVLFQLSKHAYTASIRNSLRSSFGAVSLLPKANLVSVNSPQYKDVPPRKKPFPIDYAWWCIFIDSTFKRLNVNSKLIIVEGNVGLDKAGFAKKVAEEFDMKFMPAFHVNELLNRKSGMNLLELNTMLPEHLRFWDFEMLYSSKNPEDGRYFTRTQMELFRNKLIRYLDSVSHVLNTGQGVVMEGSVFNDIVYAKSLRAMRVFSRQGYQYYANPAVKVMQYLIPPHLIIYLDAPVSYCREMITKRGRPHEQNSSILTDKFLETMEKGYTKEYLPLFLETSQLYTIDVPNMPEWEVIAEDLEEIQLDGPVVDHDEKFLLWEPDSDLRMNYIRHRHSRKMLGSFEEKMRQPPPFGIPELILKDSDYEILDKLEEHPDIAYPDYYDHKTETY